LKLLASILGTGIAKDVAEVKELGLEINLDLQQRDILLCVFEWISGLDSILKKNDIDLAAFTIL
jgi:hypothetical protein